MDFNWKILELAAWLNLILGGGWKLTRVVKDWVIAIVDAHLEQKNYATKPEVQQIHQELQHLIDKHIH